MATTLTAATKLNLRTKLKWRLFSLLEKLNYLRAKRLGSQLQLPPGQPVAALWVFVSTIGELNAVDPFLKRLLACHEHLQLVLLSDRPHYRDSYLGRHPKASVVIINGQSAEAEELAERYPPDLLVVAEIPCWPGDAPCRFPFAFLYRAKSCGARIAVVNGWLYHYPPSCRMDAIERRLFQRDYLAICDVIAVQTEDVRRSLVQAGARADRIGVAGNIKFDALPLGDWSPEKARSRTMLSSLIASSRICIVCGCVTDLAEQSMVLEAFGELRARYPEALLILAPRHPEHVEQMENLRDLLATMQIPSMFRASHPDMPVPDQIAVLVLDTIGELRDFYAVATISHVGKDHNVLEPLGFSKPVTIRAGWDETYPSYPVYRRMLDAKCLMEIDDGKQLAQAWLEMLDNLAHYQAMRQRISDAIAQARGAVARHMELLEPLFHSASSIDRESA